MTKSKSKLLFDIPDLLREVAIVVVLHHNIQTLLDVLDLDELFALGGIEGDDVRQQDHSLLHVVQLGSPSLVGGKGQELVDVADVFYQLEIDRPGLV